MRSEATWCPLCMPLSDVRSRFRGYISLCHIQQLSRSEVTEHAPGRRKPEVGASQLESTVRKRREFSFLIQDGVLGHFGLTMAWLAYCSPFQLGFHLALLAN